MDFEPKKLTYEDLEKQIEFYRNRMEAAESKLSLISRGFKIENVMEIKQ